MSHAPEFLIVLTDEALLLVRDAQASARVMQARFATYRTSHGPWPFPDIMAFMQHEFPEVLIEYGVDMIAWSSSSEATYTLQRVQT